MGRYGVKEIFRTIQGEGGRAGTSAVFVRLTGCNLWDGHPLHRDQGQGACAKWCDTDFFKGVVLELDDVLSMMAQEWPPGVAGAPRWAVLTGGEPSLQLDEELLTELHRANWRVAIETNGTQDNPFINECDWVCVSPKRGSEWTTYTGRREEVKVVLPGAAPFEEGWTDEELAMMADYCCDQRTGLYVQPQDPLLAPNVVQETRLHYSGQVAPTNPDLIEKVWQQTLAQCIRFVHKHPHWRLSPQMHKFIGVP